MKISDISKNYTIEGVTLVGSCENEEFEVLIQTPTKTFRAIKTCASNIFHSTYYAEEVVD